MTAGSRAVRRAALVASALALTAVAALWARQGAQTGRVASFLVGFAVAVLSYGAALVFSRGMSWRWLAVMLGLAVAWRLVLIPAAPMLSDDVHRYVWEGRIQLRGGNPFKWADRPEAPRWEALRDDVWLGINHKEYTAIYPPLWQILAAGVVWAHDSIAAMKAFVVACEIATWIALLLLLRRRGLPPERVLIAAWSPLALVEIAGSGHNDSLAIMLAVAALVAIETGRPWLSAVAIGLGMQAKVLPGLLGASWGRRYRLRHVLVAVAIVALLLVPYLDAGRGLIHSATKHSRFWRFNETFFAPLAAAMSHEAAVRLGALATVVVALACAARRVDGSRAALAVVGTWLALTPNVLPWYALWLLPWLVITSSPAAFVFTLTVPLAYLVYPAWLAGAPWQVGWGIRAVEYLPCVLVAVAARWGPWSGRASAPRLSLRGRDVLFVFLREPIPGEVKTRLAAAVGAQHAATVYRRMAESVVRQTQTGWGRALQVLAFSPAHAGVAIRAWMPGAATWPQPPGDLGVRMEAISRAAFSAGARRVAILGTDCPDASKEAVRVALDALEDHDVALGTAADGGYWLIALRAPAAELFRDIPWSTSLVTRRTLERAEEVGLRVALKGEGRDVDTVDDLIARWEQIEPLLERDAATLDALRKVVADRTSTPG